MFCRNLAVTVCLQKNMGLKPSVKQPRLLTLSEGAYGMNLAKWDEIDQSSFTEVSPVAMVLMYIGTGVRNKELRLAEVSDLDTRSGPSASGTSRARAATANPAPCRFRRRSARWSASILCSGRSGSSATR